MNWKIKALIQTSISYLPGNLSNLCYYFIQRKFGGLKNFSPLGGIRAGLNICKYINKSGKKVTGKKFFEVGTGRVPLAPIAFWLCGADTTYTIDVNRYLRSELVSESLLYLQTNREEIKNMFHDFLVSSRFDQLCQLPHDAPNLTSRLFELCSISYISPGDARSVSIGDKSIDYHVSNNVYEHIPKSILGAIIHEGNRITRPDGLFVNRIDYSDHFSHSDDSISAVNFLKFSEFIWHILAGNKFMYMNRLRHDDFLDIFTGCGHKFIFVDKTTDELLRYNDFSWASEEFIKKGNEILSITSAWFVTKIHHSNSN